MLHYRRIFLNAFLIYIFHFLQFYSLKPTIRNNYLNRNLQILVLFNYNTKFKRKLDIQIVRHMYL